MEHELTRTTEMCLTQIYLEMEGAKEQNVVNQNKTSLTAKSESDEPFPSRDIESTCL